MKPSGNGFGFALKIITAETPRARPADSAPPWIGGRARTACMPDNVPVRARPIFLTLTAYLPRPDYCTGENLSPSFPKWGFGNTPFRAQFHCVAGGGSGAAFPDQPLTAKHSFPAMLACPNPQFGNEGNKPNLGRRRVQSRLPFG